MGKRLIDANELLKYILSDDNRRADSMQCERYAEIVENWPTAYDVDKVKEQITDTHFDFEEVSSTKYKVLKIVEAGGLDEE